MENVFTSYLAIGGEELFDLVAVEQDFTLGDINNLGSDELTSTYHQRWWFNDDVSAQSAFTNFNAASEQYTYIFKHGSAFSYSTVENNGLTLNQVSLEDAVYVPEPSTLLLFGPAICGLLLRHKSYLKG